MLIDNISEIKKHNSAIASNIDLENLQSFIDDAIEQKIIPAISYEQFNELVKAKETELSDEQARLLNLLQKSAVGFMVYQWADQGAVTFSNVGIHVAKSEKLAPASDKKILALKKQNAASGYAALEAAVNYLEENLTSFPVYAQSEQHSNNRALLINTSAEFQQAGVLIGGDARLYQSLRVFQGDMESTYIEPILGDELLSKLRAGVISHNLNGDHQKLLGMVRKAVAFYTIVEAIPFLAISIDSTGVFQLNETVGGVSGNVENRSSASEALLSRAMYNYLQKAESQQEKIRKHLSKNSDLFFYAASPAVDINDFENRNTYYL